MAHRAFSKVRNAKPSRFCQALIFIITSLSLFPSTAFANSLTEVRQNQLKLFSFAPLETIDAFNIACSSGDSDSCEKAERIQGGEYFKPKKGFSALKDACREGNGPSCMVKGLWEQNGLGTKADLGDAMESYAEGCSAGDLPSCYMSIKLAQRSKSPSASRLAMLDLCKKGLDAGCVAQSAYIDRSSLGDISQASSVIDPLVGACENRESICDFSSILGHFSSPVTKSGLNYLVDVSRENSRRAIENEIFLRLEAAKTGTKTAPEVVAVMQAFREKNIPINSPRILEAAAGVPAVLALLLDGDVKEESLDDHGRVALLHAAQSGQVDAVRALIARGVNPNVRNGDETGWTPLQLAAVGNHIDLVDTLLKAGADPSFPNTIGSDPLMSAAKRGHTDVMQKLLTAGVDIGRINSPEYRLTALHYASAGRQFEAAALLINAGADLEAIDGTGRTALEYAIIQRQRDLVRLLLEHGADVDRTLADGRNNLGIAIAENDVEMVSWLLAAGANPNRKDINGETPIFQAIRSGNQKLAGVLLDNGADATVRNTNGVTPAILYAEIEDKRLEEQAALQRARQQELERQRQRQRQAEARRRAEAQRAAEKKKKRSGIFGAVVGAAVGAAIGTEIGLGAEQVGEFAQSFSKLGMAVEKGDAASLQEVRRDVDGLGARLEAAAPSNNPYISNSPATSNDLDDRFSPDNLDASVAERDRILAERNLANQNALNGISSTAQTPTYSAQSQSAPKTDPVFKQRTLKMTMPNVRTCMTIADQNSPNFGRTTCDNSASQGREAGGNERNSGNASEEANDMYNSNGDGFSTNNNSGSNSAGNNGNGSWSTGNSSGNNIGSSSSESGRIIDAPPPAKIRTVVRGTDLTREEYDEVVERYGCRKPTEGCLFVTERRYDPDTGQLLFRIENRCDESFAYRYSLPKKSGARDEGSHWRRTRGDFTIYTYGAPDRQWEPSFIEMWGADVESGKFVCRKQKIFHSMPLRVY